MGETKCGHCRNPVGDDGVKLGKYRYHPDCADKKPRSRQSWNGHGWQHIGVWSDEEDATLEAHSS